MMGHKRLRPSRAESARTASQKGYSLRHIAVFDLDPSAEDRSHRAPVRETLLSCCRNQLVCALSHGCVVADEAKQPGAQCQAQCERRRVSQSPRLSNCRVAPCQRLVRKAETEKDKRQKC